MNEHYNVKNIKDFRSLLVWQKSIEFSDIIYTISKKFPSFEEFSVKSQIIRSTNSISANIAEGNGNIFPKKEITHINIALGSATETRHWLHICERQGYISSDDFMELDYLIEEIIKMLFGYLKRVNNSLKTT